VVAPDDPVMIVVGGGAIALGTAQELCTLQGHRVVAAYPRLPASQKVTVPAVCCSSPL